MKKILCIIDGLEPGGSQRQLTGLAVLLKRNGYDVTVLWYHKEDFFRYVLDNNSVNCISITPNNKISKLSSIKHYIHIQKPDVVITYLDGPNIIGCILKMIGFGFKLIVSERNTTQRVTFRDKIKYCLYNYADVIVPNSYSQTDFIRSSHPEIANKVNTITNYVDSTKFRYNNKQTSEFQMNILSIGRICEQKNLLKYLKVISEVKKIKPEIHFDWYGTAKDIKYLSKVNDLYHQLQIENHLTFHEPQQSIEDIYYKADVLCLPSLYEGFPNVICEAICCGLPIICSDVCDNGYLVKNGINGFLFNPQSEASMTNTILQLIDNIGVIKENISVFYPNILKRVLTPSEFANKYITILEDI